MWLRKSARHGAAWEGAEWIDRGRFEDVVAWAARLDGIEAGTPPDAGFVRRMGARAEAAGYRLDRLLPAAAAGTSTTATAARPPRATRSPRRKPEA